MTTNKKGKKVAGKRLKRRERKTGRDEEKQMPNSKEKEKRAN